MAGPRHRRAVRRASRAAAQAMRDFLLLDIGTWDDAPRIALHQKFLTAERVRPAVAALHRAQTPGPPRSPFDPPPDLVPAARAALDAAQALKAPRTVDPLTGKLRRTRAPDLDRVRGLMVVNSFLPESADDNVEERHRLMAGRGLGGIVDTTQPRLAAYASWFAHEWVHDNSPALVTDPDERRQRQVMGALGCACGQRTTQVVGLEAWRAGLARRRQGLEPLKVQGQEVLVCEVTPLVTLATEFALQDVFGAVPERCVTSGRLLVRAKYAVIPTSFVLA